MFEVSKWKTIQFMPKGLGLGFRLVFITTCYVISATSRLGLPLSKMRKDVYMCLRFTPILDFYYSAVILLPFFQSKIFVKIPPIIFFFFFEFKLSFTSH